MKHALLAACCTFALLFAAPAAFADSCSATKTCASGPAKTCNGVSTCQVLTTGVRCDGVTTSCGTACSISYDCPVPPFTKEWFLSCTGTSSCTRNTSNHSITCDGTTKTCQACENGTGGLCPF
jgi:hypothetical protein